MILKGNLKSGFFNPANQRVYLTVGNLRGKNTDSVLKVEGTPGNTQLAGGADGCEMAQGVFKVAFARNEGQQFLSTGATTDGNWGGAPDMGARVEVYNYALSTPSYGGLQALRVYAYSTASGNLNNILGAEISVYERSSYATAGKGCETAETLKVSQRCRGVIGTRTNLLIVDDRSDGSQHTDVQGTAATKCYNTAMIRLHSEGGASFAQRASGIHFGSAGTGTGWAHTFSFQTAAGKEGFTAVTDKAVKGNIDGYIKVYDVATAQTLYIALYDTVPS